MLEYMYIHVYYVCFFHEAFELSTKLRPSLNVSLKTFTLFSYKDLKLWRNVFETTDYRLRLKRLI